MKGNWGKAESNDSSSELMGRTDEGFARGGCSVSQADTLQEHFLKDNRLTLLAVPNFSPSNDRFPPVLKTLASCCCALVCFKF